MKGPKKGYKQSIEHIQKRIESRTKWNGGHNRLTTVTFLFKLKEKWPNCPYDLSMIKYIKNNIKITLGCKSHGNFDKWPSDVLNQSGCPKCSKQGFSKQEYLQELIKTFPQYDFSKSVYVNALTNMHIECNVHGTFNLSRNGLLNGIRCPECAKISILQSRIKSGRAKDPATLNDYDLYKREVWKETNRSYKMHKETLGIRSKDKHLDHIYSILHGFRENIPPIILGNIVNLRIIDSKQNQSKNVKSEYTKEELMRLYEGKL